MDTWPFTLPQRQMYRLCSAVALSTSVEKQRSRAGSMSDSDRCVAANVNSTIISKTGAQTPRPAASARTTIALNSAHLISPNALPVRAIMLSMTVTARNGMKRGKLSVGGSSK